MSETLPVPAPRRRRAPWLPSGLSGRLLVLTMVFAMAAQILVVVPLTAQFHDRWLVDRVRAAELASLAVEAAPDQMVSDVMAAELLEGARVEAVAIKVGGLRRLVLAGPPLSEPPRAVDLRGRGPASWLLEPWRALFDRGGRLRVIAEPGFRRAEFIEIVVPAAPLRIALADYVRRVLAISLFTSAATGALVWLALSRLLVRPMRRLTDAIARFRANPDDPAARVEMSGRDDEIGRAEVELSRMQSDLRAALHSRARLAALGEAVAKINHDMRNMLTSAQIASERLSGSGDPRVAQALPRLERALDRGIMLATNVLAYGRSAEPEPRPTSVALQAAVQAAGEDAGLADDGVRLDNAAPAYVRVRADPDQLNRILVNLMRNAREAVESAPERDGRGRVRVEHERRDDSDLITVSDDGPGIPAKAQARLFQAFGSGRSGGTGLGLAIARELAQGHGGDLSLLSTGPEGTAFRVRLPA